MEKVILDRLTTLGHAQRMAVFRLLVRRYPSQVPAGELGLALGIKPSTMSVYLSALQNCGLVARERRGTSLLYRANMAGAESMITFLFQDCCQNRPELCMAPLSEGATRKQNVLFLCTGNATRSLFAESILNELGQHRFAAFSAGTQPASAPNPDALKTLVAQGHDPSALYPKPVVAFQGAAAPKMDFVITVCDRAANEDCPAWPGQPVATHWGVPDPQNTPGSEAEKSRAYLRCYEGLRRKITRFIALTHAPLGRQALQAGMDEIATEGHI